MCHCLDASSWQQSRRECFSCSRKDARRHGGRWQWRPRQQYDNWTDYDAQGRSKGKGQGSQYDGTEPTRQGGKGVGISAALHTIRTALHEQEELATLGRMIAPQLQGGGYPHNP